MIFSDTSGSGLGSYAAILSGLGQDDSDTSGGIPLPGDPAYKQGNLPADVQWVDPYGVTQVTTFSKSGSGTIPKAVGVGIALVALALLFGIGGNA